MEVPSEFRSYECSDYFASQLAQTGWWDPDGQCWYIEPANRIYEDPEREFLVIGRPGTDGIEWGYRRGRSGIWAHYPIEQSFVFLAGSANSLRDGYAEGRIKL